MTDLRITPVDAPSGAVASAVSWPAILAGAVVAMAVTLIFVSLGAGFGLGSAAAWPGAGPGPKTFTVMVGVWLIVTQWVSAGFGGYVTGRLRTRWTGTHTHEVFFRDTANGFVTWALASVTVAAVGFVVAGVGAPQAATAAADAAVAVTDASQKAAASFAVFNAVAMLIGAFIACVAAALGGQQRDEHI
jgi:hypothetical protein